MTWLEFLVVGAASGLVFPLVFRAAREWRVRAAALGAVLGVVTGALVWLGGAHDSATLATALWASMSFAMVGGWVLTETGGWQPSPLPQLAGEAGAAGGAAVGPVGQAEPDTPVEQPERAEPDDQPAHGDADASNAEPPGDAEPPGNAGGG